jgi:fluoroacetyl-CoA thioesterase
MSIAEGQTWTVETIVRPDMTAHSTADREGERYPDVLGTPFLVSEMERVAAALLQPFLSGDEVSVGVAIDIKHLAPTPVGEPLNSHARFTGREGKLFWFEVWAEDAAGIVGKGRHSRAVVNLPEIESRAARRRAAA